ncbi:MAG: hypothetical protein CMI16_12605 [Opitutaceae bacterium]|nr:hypothetical protein [Opitutaceae bacterium]|tara:strand:- start:665 stop:2644 length:1980 start_codon:yes stop_codon:yes gene_type:complete
MEPDAQFDTLDNLLNTSDAKGLEFLNSTVLPRLGGMVGVVVFGEGGADPVGSWGPALSMATGETISMRFQPKGVLFEIARGVELETMVTIATRRSSEQGTWVSFTLLWPPSFVCNKGMNLYTLPRLAMRPLAARNLNVLLPSIFSHHDASHGRATRNGKLVRGAWPVHDFESYHAIRPDSFLIDSEMEHLAGAKVRVQTCAAGKSQWVLAGQIGGTEIEDQTQHSSERVCYAQWSAITARYTQTLVGGLNSDAALESLANAMAVADVLTLEGVVSMLEKTSAPSVKDFAQGAIPDGLQLPRNFPTLIAFAVRVACSPRVFGLAEGTAEDTEACREVVRLFETTWSPLKCADGSCMMAIDFAIRSGLKEAHKAEQEMDGLNGKPVEDNLCFWQRAGQRCISAIFGFRSADFDPMPTSEFGSAPNAVDPMAEARAKWARSVMRRDPLQRVNTPIDADPIPNGFWWDRDGDRRGALLGVLNSVEQWLRSGRHNGRQLDGCDEELAREQLRVQLSQGVEKSVREMLDNGEAASEAEARRAAEVVHQQVEQVLRLRKAPVAHVVNKHAVERASAMITAACCQGPMVHLEMESRLGVFLCCEHATSLCADCNSPVHVLQASLLSTSCSKCDRCMRARCYSCAVAAAKDPQVRAGCQRCRSRAKKR